MKTKFISKESAVENRNWVLINAEGKPVGRVASKVAHILRGKHKATYTPNQNTGDFVIVINAAKAVFTGNKLDDKKYYDYSGFIGGQRVQTAKEIMESNPTDIIHRAVKGMIPQTPLGYDMLSKLKVYAGPEHRHQAQKPVEVNV